MEAGFSFPEGWGETLGLGLLLPYILSNGPCSEEQGHDRPSIRVATAKAEPSVCRPC